MSKERAAQLVEAGIWLKLSGDLEGARKLFERALQLDPENDRVREMVSSSPSAIQRVVVADAPVTSANPFERPDNTSSPSQVEFSDAGFGPAVPTRSATPAPEKTKSLQDTLGDDWGALTGSLDDPNAAERPPSTDVAVPASSDSMGGMTVTMTSTTGRAVIKTPTPFAPASPFSSPSVITDDMVVDSTPAARAPSGIRPAPPGFGGAANVTLDGGGDDTGPTVDGDSTDVPMTFDSPTPFLVTTPSGVYEPAPGIDARPTQPSHPQVALLEQPPAPVDVFAAGGPMPAEPAWSWDGPTDRRTPSAGASRSPMPQQSFTPPPMPPKTPNLAQFAESAWDAQSNPGIKLQGPPDASALELVEAAPPAPSAAPKKGEVQTLLRGARDLLDLDDHTGAMELILKAQGVAPDDNEVVALRERSEQTLLAMFESKLGDLNAMPRVMLKDDEIIWLNLDHRAGFVLAQIDGTVSFDDLFAVSGMSRLDTARIIAQLIDEGVISRG